MSAAHDLYAAPRAAIHRPDDLHGPAGLLEALFTGGSPTAPYAAVVSHPHPLYGGSMHNKVVYHAAKALSAVGLPVLRYNFRGVGHSAGVHDRGAGEADDLRAAMGWLARETGLPLLLCGFSFGAWVSLRVACEGPAPQAVHGVAALGLPIQAGDRSYTYPALRNCALPKLFVSGAADAFGPRAEVEAVVTTAHPPAQLVWVEAADHFFVRPPGHAQPGSASGLAELQAAITTWLNTHFLSPALSPSVLPGDDAWM